MAGPKIPTELLIQIAAYLEPDACYRLIQAIDGLDQFLACEIFMRKAIGTGNTIVHLAAKRGDVQLIQTILNKGVDIQVQNNLGVAPLADSARRGRQGVVELLLSAGAKVDEPDHRQLTALHGAAHQGSAPVVQLLLDAGADAYSGLPSITYPTTAMHWAAREGRISIVSLLLERNSPSKIPESWDGALVLAAKHGRTEVVQLLINVGFTVSDKTLQAAASAGRAKIVKMLLEHKDFNETARREALLESVMQGYHSVVKLLIKSGLNISQEDYKFACPVAYSGSTRILRLLHNAGVDYSKLYLSKLKERGKPVQGGQTRPYIPQVH